MSLKKYENRLIVPRDKVKKDPAKVGQAVYDIMSKPQASQTVEETIEAMTDKYFEKLKEAAEEGVKAGFPNIFYVLLERKKETLMGNANNVLKHRYMTLPFRPKAAVCREECPNSDFDLYEINKSTNEITLLWTLPTKQDSRTILKNPHLYDPNLVQWIRDFDKGLLDHKKSLK
jgi:hypothetical protein